MKLALGFSSFTASSKLLMMAKLKLKREKVKQTFFSTLDEAA
jgi:hypothetical protein